MFGYKWQIRDDMKWWEWLVLIPALILILIIATIGDAIFWVTDKVFSSD